MNENQHQTQIVEINEADFESVVLQSPQPVLVEFSATWSRACHILDLVLDEVATACAGRMKVIRVNADDNPELSLWYGIQSIPTLLYFLGGRVQARIVGTASKEAILAKFQSSYPSGKAGSHSSSTNHAPERHNL